LVFRLVSREGSQEVAIVCVALTAVTAWSVYLSTALLSETTFAALCTGALLALRREEIRGTAGREWLAAGLLAGLACLTRSAGVCVVATGVVFFLSRRRAGAAVKFLVAALLVCGPWFWWVAVQHPPETDAYYSAANYAAWNVLSRFFPLDRKLTVVCLNALMVLRSPLAIAGLRNGALSVAASLAVLLAGLRWLRTWTVADTFLGIYVAMTLAWAWPPDRFLVVVYPLILCAVWRVYRAGVERFPKYAAMARAAGVALVWIVAFHGVWELRDSARVTASLGVVPVMGPQDAWRDTSAQLDWIRENTAADSVVMANLDPVFYLYTGRKAVRGFQADPYRLFYMPEPGSQPLGPLAELRRTIQDEGVTYIVRAPNNVFAEAPYLDRLLEELVRSAPDTIRMVAQGRDARFRIYRVEGPLSLPGGAHAGPQQGRVE
jgi:hypothetical protein